MYPQNMLSSPHLYLSFLLHIQVDYLLPLLSFANFYFRWQFVHESRLFSIRSVNFNCQTGMFVGCIEVSALFGAR